MPFLSNSAMTLAASATERKSRSSFDTITNDLQFFAAARSFAARWTTCERFAATDSRILEHLGQVKSLHIAVGGNALALGFESQATIGLFFT